MKVYLKAGGILRDKLQPDVDEYTRLVEMAGSPSLAEILEHLGIDRGFVAFAMIGDRLERLDYRPRDGEVLSLHPPVAGG